MLFHDQTFKERLKFFELNICGFPEQLCEKDINHSSPEQVIMGLKELQQLFLKLYTALDLFFEDEPLESLHNVTNTIMFLYSAGFTGILCKTGTKWYWVIDKKQIKDHYKQSITKPVEDLKQFGFYYEYHKNGQQVETLTKCTHFYMYCDYWDNIPLAVNYIINNTQLELTADDYTRMQGLFYKLDYRSMFLKESTKREELDPFREDIQKTAGVHSELLVSLLKGIFNNYPLISKIKFHEYYTPHWILQFYTVNTDKFIFNLNTAADIICLEIRLSVETVEELAARKMEITGQLKKELEKFGCISCNNKCSGKNLMETNGVCYCTAHSEARLLMLYIASEEDVESALMVLDCENKNINW